MQRVIALKWDVRDADAGHRARALSEAIRLRLEGWTCVFTARGAGIFHKGGEARRLAGGAGCLIGDVFARGAPDEEAASHARVGAHADREIALSRGAALIGRFWGAYLAFLYDEGADRLDVIRDPSGARLCFHGAERGVRVIFSHAEDVRGISALRLAVDWDRVRVFLIRERLQTRFTALCGIGEVQPGERLTLERETVSSRALWRPDDLCRRPDLRAPEVLARRLRTEIRSCAATWAAGGAARPPSLLHRLSGGLDSSIVLAALMQAPARGDLACVHYYFADAPEADERPLARQAAERAGVPLFEVEMAPDGVDWRRALCGELQPRPSTSILSFADPRPDALAASIGARRITSGEGGDHLFYRIRSALIAADAIRAAPLNVRARTAILESARASRRSTWAVARDAVVYGLLRAPFDIASMFPALTPFLTPEAIRATPPEDLLHLWAREAGDVPPGKLAHLWILADALKYRTPAALNRPGQGCPILLSQPIIEACLEIPTYLLTAGGRDRALVRAAFADDAPPQILGRESKGLTTRYFSGALIANAAFLQDMLLGGALVRERLLDRVKLEQALTGSALGEGRNVGALLSSLATEIWLSKLAGPAAI